MKQERGALRETRDSMLMQKAEMAWKSRKRCKRSAPGNHQSGNRVHINDQWLYYNPTDYDCLTHEFSHLLQEGWSVDYLENSDTIERFADYCRYIYAYNEGEYNDGQWELQTVWTESTREASVRFLVWLDYYYSTSKKDLIREWSLACSSQSYEPSQWEKAWKKLLKGTKLKGKSMEEVWKKYEASDFAVCSSVAEDGKSSELIRRYDVRRKIRSRKKSTQNG